MKRFFIIAICFIFPLSLFSQVKSKTFNLIENAYVNMSSVNLEFENQYTVMGWMRWSSLSSNGQSWAEIVEMNNIEDESFRHFWIQSNEDNSRVEFAMQLIPEAIGQWSENSMTEGEWFHFAAVYNGQQQILYINGEKESGKMSTGHSDNFNADFTLSLGSFAAWNFNNNYLGDLDNVSVWNRALTESEIEYMLCQEVPTYCNGLMSFYSRNNVDNNILNSEIGFKHIAMNNNDNYFIDELNKNEIEVNHNKEEYINWESNIAYQKAQKSDQVYVLYNDKIYKLKTWYSFNQNPEDNLDIWEYIYNKINDGNTFAVDSK